MLANKTILITGAFSGIGKAATELFMQSKAKVVAVGRNAQNKVPSYATNYLPIVRNIRTEHDAQEVVEFALEKYSQIDIVLHCAGKGILKPAQDLSKADFDVMMADNFYSAVLMTQAVLPHFLLKKEGTLLFVPGVAGVRGLAGGAAYTAAKFATVGYARSLREDVRRSRIKITTLILGAVNSEFYDEMESSAGARDKMMTCQDAARAIWFAAQQPDSAVMSEMVLQPLAFQTV
jgi:NADP-dependent 3-hydroxy acid dehydrogenase YdfG